jgi:hypothetical protein
MENAIFEKIDGKLHKLFEDIDYGELGLPELQRPFVWENKKVRDLFDSMYRGFPIGYFLLWKNETDNKNKLIGENKDKKVPNRLIIDGQQRLTGSYSVFKNRKVLDNNYNYRNIIISFNPLTEEFQVANASTSRNKEYIENISDVFQQSSYSFITKYLKQLEEYREQVEKIKEKIKLKINENKYLNSNEIEFVISRFNQMKESDDEQGRIMFKLKDKIYLEDLDKKIILDILNNHSGYNQEIITQNIERLANLGHYPFQALQIASNVDEEQVAEIFTRINSKGTKLNQTDFIITLLSVYWEEGRKEIDDFCKLFKKQNLQNIKESPFNHIIHLDTQDIVRINTGVGFKRGRMKDVYSILKGRDLNTRKFSEKLREEQFLVFKEKHKVVLDNTNWHEFLRILIKLGFKSKELISSSMAVINSYILFLIGKTEFKLDYHELDENIGRWFFMSIVSSRYSSSPESQMDADLNKVKVCKNKIDFISFINKTIESNLTNDFWNITLPKDLLETSSAKSPAGNTYFACLNRLKAPILFSERLVTDVFSPELNLKKKVLERHHIFPKNYLKKLGFEQTMRNQIANMTYLEYSDNIKISDKSPKEYFNKIIETKFKDKDKIVNEMLELHAIPENFEDLSYDEFIEKRRILMAKIIKRGYDSI